MATLTFFAQLVNYRVVSNFLAYEILVFLLSRPTDASVEMAVSFARKVGQFLEMDVENGKFLAATYTRFQELLRDDTSQSLDKRTQHMIEALFVHRKTGYRDDPCLSEELDLVETDNLIVHQIFLDRDYKVEPELSKLITNKRCLQI